MFKWLKKLLKRSNATYAQVIPRALMTPPTRSGVSVTPLTALGIPAYQCGVRVIAEAMGIMPLITYQRVGKGKERATFHPVYRLLHDTPNDECDAFDFFSSVTANALIHGNGYAEIVRDGAGRPTELHCIPTERVTPTRDSTGRLIYRVSTYKGEIVTLLPDDIIHIKGLSLDGIAALSPIWLCREAISLSIAAERFASAWWGNGSRPSGYLKTPGQLSDQAQANLQKSWHHEYGGVDNAGSIPILEEGVEFVPTSVTPEEGQHIQTRQHQVLEVARVLNINPIFLQASPAWTAIEPIISQFYRVTLLPWVRRWEQQLNRKMFSTAEQGTFFVEHLLEGFLRADTLQRFQVYQIGRNIGVWSANDIRQKENENPVEGGDTYLTPLNMADASETPEEPEKPEDTQEDNGNTPDQGGTPGAGE